MPTKRTSTASIAPSRDNPIPLDADGFPEWLPVLEPGDIGIHRGRHPNGSPCCAIGWRIVCGGSSNTTFAIAFNNAYLKMTGIYGIAKVNDNATPARRAELWNLTIAALGYDVENATYD